MQNEGMEPKETVDPVDAAFAAVEGQTEGEQPGNAPAQTEQPGNVEGVTDTQKTDSTQTPAPQANEKPVDRGFADHPAWIEREQKLKEARERADQFERELQRVSSFLDDPKKLVEVLTKQGYELKKREAEQGGALEFAAKKMGWNLQTVTPDQMAYIKDLAGLAESIAEYIADKKIAERVAPVEEFVSSNKNQGAIAKEIESVRTMAKEHGFDFEKDIMPKLEETLAELDRQDPERTKKFDLAGWAKDLMLKSLREKITSNGRQEKRDEVKKTLQPLTPSVSAPASVPSTKFPSWQKDPKGFDDRFNEVAAQHGL